MKKKLKTWITWWSALVLLLIPGMIQFCGQPTNVTYEPRMVNGMKPDASNPASYSAVALVNKMSQQSFCSGTIVAEKLIVTAAHCIFKKRPQDMQVMFGSSTGSEDSVVRDVVARETFKTEQKYGSNFDIGWLKLAEPIPEGFRPIEIWHDSTVLTANTPLVIAGYGQTASTCGFNDPSCRGGVLSVVDTNIQRFVDTNRLYSLIVIGPQPMEGPCFGDSGGPAYLKYGGKWYLAGDFMGWDKILVPEDRATICDTGEAIYNFVGDYVRWIEESSGVDLAYHETTNPRMPPRELPEMIDEPRSFTEWCEYTNYRDPAWYTVQRIIRLAAEAELERDSSFDASLPFSDCQQASELVQDHVSRTGRLRLVGFDPKENIDYARLEDLSPIRSLADWGLKELILADHSISGLAPIEALTSLQQLEVVDNQTANLNGDESESLDRSQELDISKLTHLKELRINNPNAAIDFSGIDQIRQLSVLDLTHVRFTDLGALAELPLRQLRLENVELGEPGPLPPLPKLESLKLRFVDVTDIQGTMPKLTKLQVWDSPSLAGVDPTGSPALQSLVLYGIGIQQLPSLEGFSQLETLSVIGNRQLNTMGRIGNLPKLKRLEIINNGLTSVQELHGMPELEEMIVSQNQLMEIPVTTVLPKLTNLDVNGNRLETLDFLRMTPALTYLDASRNLELTAAEIADLPKLERLAVENQKGRGLENLDNLRNLPALREINLKSNSLESLTPLTRFADLEVVLASHNFIKSVAELKSLNKLDFLELIDNPLTDQTCPIDDRGGKCRFKKISLNF
jgi:hypothetical protein